ncbi:phage portal protein, partial [Pseudomonas aeruginosa]
GINPVDAQLLESRAFSVESICRWFRVPPWMVGHTEKSTSWGTGIEQQMIGFLTFTLGPWLRRIEQSISKDLMTPAERTRFYPKFAVEGLLRADSAGRAAFYAAMVNNGILTRDEVRELEDREPMGGNAAVLTVQSAMTTLDALGQEGGADQANQARAAFRAFLGFNEEPQKG